MKASIATIALLSASALAYVPNPYYKRNLDAEVKTPCEQNNAAAVETPYITPTVDLVQDIQEPTESHAADVILESEETPCSESGLAPSQETEVAPEEPPVSDVGYEVPQIEEPPAYVSVLGETPTDLEVPAAYDATVDELSTYSEVPAAEGSAPDEPSTDSEVPPAYDSIPVETPTCTETIAADHATLETPTASEIPAAYDNTSPIESATASEVPAAYDNTESIPEDETSVPMSGSATNTASIFVGLLMLAFIS